MILGFFMLPTSDMEIKKLLILPPNPPKKAIAHSKCTVVKD